MPPASYFKGREVNLNWSVAQTSAVRSQSCLIMQRAQTGACRAAAAGLRCPARGEYTHLLCALQACWRLLMTSRPDSRCSASAGSASEWRPPLPRQMSGHGRRSSSCLKQTCRSHKTRWDPPRPAHRTLQLSHKNPHPAHEERAMLLHAEHERAHALPPPTCGMRQPISPMCQRPPPTPSSMDI